MTNYYIFKRDYLTGKTMIICNGSHNDERECRIHWQSYMYGFMDGAFEMLGRDNFQMQAGTHKLSFLFTAVGRNVEYFMLFDQAGRDLIEEIA